MYLELFIFLVFVAGLAKEAFIGKQKNFGTVSLMIMGLSPAFYNIGLRNFLILNSILIFGMCIGSGMYLVKIHYYLSHSRNHTKSPT